MAWYRSGSGGESLTAELNTQKTDIEALAKYIADIQNDANGTYVWGKYASNGGDLLDYVSSASETAYPDGGASGGYYYKRIRAALTGISVATMPAKTNYAVGNTFDPTGMVVVATYETGRKKEVTNYTYSPKTLNTVGTRTVTISYTENGVTKTTTLSVTVKSFATVTWAAGTDAEICEMIAAADRGEIKLSDYWSAGDKRTVQLSAMAATGVGETHAAQSVTFVLKDATCKGLTLATATTGGKTKPDFIVGMENCLKEAGYMNSSNTNTNGWSGTSRRPWCNNTFRMAIPETLRGIFKQFKWKQGTGGGASSGLIETTDYFGLPPAKAVFGSASYSFSDEAALYEQWEWYKTSANRIKKLGDTGSAYSWWECSPYSGNSLYFCNVNSGGIASSNSASNTDGLAPFGCI